MNADTMCTPVNACPSYTPYIPPTVFLTRFVTISVTVTLAVAITLMTTTTTTAPCSESTAGLLTTTVTEGPFQSISLVITPTQSSCAPNLPQFASQQTDSITLAWYSEPDAPAQGPSSNATSALGALLGICMAVLALVTVEWVWTCWTNRKKILSGNTSQNIRYQLLP